ncbi:hypothetical protein DPX39_100064400 [Trypanosoma brucei equiperdum]|uniref:Uncharacterized protein n=2 Tax=Trypanosoma brucei TaxID=5691 RepID=A0A3L6KYH4_9TRYP|nr:hypothetical protein DPX39_100064400 [Trypanosoma brucei equiperdum]
MSFYRTKKVIINSLFSDSSWYCTFRFRNPMTSQRRSCHEGIPSGRVTGNSVTPLSEMRENNAIGVEAVGKERKRPDAMTVLSNVFRTNPAALRLHRELTICIANGETERASDLASVLAGLVKRTTRLDDIEQKCAEEGGRSKVPNDPVPVVSEETVEFLTSNVVRGVSSQSRLESIEILHNDAPGAPYLGEKVAEAAEVKDSEPLPFWKNPDALRLTLLESAFEMALADDNENPLQPGSVEADCLEKERMEILDAYLKREGKRWELQKAAVARAIVATVKDLGVVPEDIHAALQAEGELRLNGSDKRFNVLKHCNIIVRGEVPEVMELQMKGTATRNVEASVSQELDVLINRMSSTGTPLSQRDKDLALFELVMSKSKMRYVVGLHRELQVALDTAPALRKLAVEHRAKSGSVLFVERALKMLNKVAPDGSETTAEDVECIDTISTPVLPFTFMLKMCLWFEAPVAM